MQRTLKSSRILQVRPHDVHTSVGFRWKAITRQGVLCPLNATEGIQEHSNRKFFLAPVQKLSKLSQDSSLKTVLQTPSEL